MFRKLIHFEPLAKTIPPPDAGCSPCATWQASGAMSSRPHAAVLEPAAVAEWLVVDVDWVLDAIERDGLPILGRRSDGVPLLARDEVVAWLQRRSAPDDRT